MTGNSSRQKKSHYQLSVKEFKFAFSTTMIYILLSCAISYLLGYNKPVEEIPIIWGMPSWILFGVVIPWILMVLLTIIYGFFVMEGDDD
ncbi:MAG: DUF997 family protein [Aminivibrio sp.]